MPFTLIEIACIFAIMTVAATVQCSIGFGATLVALPVLAIIDPVFAPAPLVLVSIPMGILILLRDRSGIHLDGLRYALPGMVVGIGLGIAFLHWFPPEQMNLALGTALVVAVLISASGFHLAITRRSLFGTGTLSGFMGTLSALGGAPLGLLYQKESGARLRSTLSCLMLTGAFTVMLGLSLSGRVGREEIQAFLYLLPAVVVGFVLSYKVAPVLDSGYMRRVILAFAGLGGVVLLVRTLYE